VVLEATGDYWRGVYYLLEDTLNVMLVNAAHAKGLPGPSVRTGTPPQRVGPWDGERDATAPGPTAAQSAYPPPMDTVLPSSVAPGDDYLNVSVWAPTEGSWWAIISR